MRIEHIALNVPDPLAMAKWYADNLGMRIVRSSGAPAFGHFIADASGSVLLEIYRNSDAPIPDYSATDPATLHLAFIAENICAERDRLVAAGAVLVKDVPEERACNVDEFAMLRDPWGIPLQLAKRAETML